MKYLIFLFLSKLLFVTFYANAEEVKPKSGAVVQKLIGAATFNKKAIHENELITGSGLLETKDRSYVKIFSESWGSAVSVGPRSSMNINFVKAEKGVEPTHYILNEGICRWVSSMKKDHPEGSRQVKTKTAAFGVRGTDFIIKYLGTEETVLSVLDGSVLFRSELVYPHVKGADALITKGQFAGVGGKYGKTISGIRSLTQEEIKMLADEIP